MTGDIERRVLAKVSRRLLPLVAGIYFIAYIDRTNVSFAALTMNRDLGFSPYVFGWGAGIFFLGYFIFEVPSNLILERVGARRWISRIMITWGLASAATAFVSGPVSFFVLRFLLGVAEAGLFPGMILYFTYWYPTAYRARVISAFYVAAPASNVLSALVSGYVLKLDGFGGLAGWKWLFILEAIPAVLIGFVVLKMLTDRPASADWLSSEERELLEARLSEERRVVSGGRHPSLARALTDRRVVALSAIYLAITSASYGIAFFLPQIVKSLGGLSNLQTGFMTAIPYAVGTVGMFFWGYSSDRHNERRWHFILGCVLTAAGLSATAMLPGTYWALVAMAIASVGVFGTKPAFWPIPSLFLTGREAAAGIALINAVGNLGGFVGPYAVGWIRDRTGKFEWGLHFLAGCAFAAAVVAVAVLRPSVLSPGARVSTPTAAGPVIESETQA